MCYRHPDRESHIRCTRCERPICPDCMVPASVGFQCPECVAQGHRDVRQARTQYGGRISQDPGYVTKVLLAVNVVMFLLQQVVDGLERRLFSIGLATLPDGDVIGIGAGEGYRLLTAAFLHGGLLHLLFNMYALWLFGPPLEQAFGRARFLGVYLLSALGGSTLSYAFAFPAQASLGASGAIFGLFGAYLVVARHLGRDTSMLLVLLVLNGVLGFLVPRIDWRAHLGGFLIGALLALVLVGAPRARRALVHTAGFALVAVLVLAGALARTAELGGTGVDDVLRCSATEPTGGVDYLRCVDLVD